jgi:hypothetical protein
LVLLAGLLGGCGFRIPAAASTDAAAGDVIADAAIDQVDAPVTCPTSYTATYRLEMNLHTWLDAEKACEADAPGITHLVVIENDSERIAVSDLVQNLLGDAWVGIVRDPGGVAPWPWRYVTGGPAVYAPFEGSEPNNMSGDQYTLVMRKSSRLLYDYGIANLLYAVCECDGHAPVNADFDPATP